MKTIDLNICPSKFQNENIHEALCALIYNNVIQPLQTTWQQNIKVAYDEVSQELKIINDDFNLIPSYFVQQEPKNDAQTYDFNEAIAILLARNFTITFTSNFGIFKLIVKQKEGINDPLPNVYIEYEENDAITSWNNLKDLYNNQLSNQTKTTITISPVATNLAIYLQKSFCYLQNWKQIYKTPAGNLLIANQNIINDLYLEGVKTSFNSKISIPLIYNYDVSISKDFSDPNDVDFNTVNKFIASILIKLTNEDKKQIYPNLLNNLNSYEWTISKVQEDIITFFNHQTKDQYVIYSDNNQDERYVSLIKEFKKTLIKVNEDVYETLCNQVPNINKVGQELICQKYFNKYINEDLSLSELNNLNLLDQFIVYFANHFMLFKHCLQQHKLDKLTWLVYDDFEGNSGIYNFIGECGMIARKNLSNLGNLFDVGCKITSQFASSINPQDFENAWLVNSINFLTNYKVKKENWLAEDLPPLTKSNHHDKKLS